MRIGTGSGIWAIALKDLCAAHDRGEKAIVQTAGLPQLWLRDEKPRARQLIEAMGDSPEPLWGRVVYHLLTSDLDAAADWYDRMIEHRGPFTLVYARASIVEPLRGHRRWPELATR